MYVCNLNQSFTSLSHNMDKYIAFKHILEYFVAHLEWAQNGDKNGPGYMHYIEPLVSSNTFYTAGQGYSGHGIQNAIAEWSDLPEGRVCINVQSNRGFKYTTRGCYLNWIDTGINVIAKWNKPHIVGLEIRTFYTVGDKKKWTECDAEATLGELGLFDGTENANSTLASFYDVYCKLLKETQIMWNADYFINILKSNHNLILNGAPGTGKTFLAKTIAAQMICKKPYSEDLEKDSVFSTHCCFVQFHPSYDYTDFVEGLRPEKEAGENIAFRRKDGVFKAFCKRAVTDTMVNGVDNFDEAWDRLVEALNEKGEIEIQLLSGSKTMLVELNVNGDGLANRTYDTSLCPTDSDVDKKEWVRGKSKFFNKEQLYNIYRGLPGIPSGGHDHYRKAIVEEMKRSFGLKPYQAGWESLVDNSTPYVFIIDEINRGEISKIFGELFFSIDPGYRGTKGLVLTQYQNLVEATDVFFNGFYVPKNVYIIGTMNDIDRSVESMDFAMRRRFAFEEIFANDNVAMLDGIPEKDVLIERMKKLNEIIAKEPELGVSYQVGGAYFAKAKDCRLENGSIDWQSFWTRHLRGLLNEYTRGLQNKTTLIVEMEKAVVAPNTVSSAE